MRISKKRIREIFVAHINENHMSLNHIVKEKPWVLGLFCDLLSRGRRPRGTDEYWACCVWQFTERTLVSIGYRISYKPNKAQVCVKMFSLGGKHIWVHIPSKVAEKILVFGTVPNLGP
jgi:hypothetical protein